MPYKNKLKVVRMFQHLDVMRPKLTNKQQNKPNQNKKKMKRNETKRNEMKRDETKQ